MTTSITAAMTMIADIVTAPVWIQASSLIPETDAAEDITDIADITVDIIAPRNGFCRRGVLICKKL